MATVSRGTRWSFTVDWHLGYDTPPLLQANIKFGIVGEEEGNNGLCHLQGYVELKRKLLFGQVKRLFENSEWANVHIELSKAGRDANVAYCSKQGNFWYLHDQENGASPDSDGQDEWSAVWNRAQVGGAAHVAEVNPQAAVRNYSALQAIHRQAERDNPVPLTPLDAPCGLWIWGDSGTGKTTFARELAASFGGLYVRAATASLRWDGFGGQQSVLFDDADPTSVKGQEQMLKQATDKFPFTVTRIYEGEVLIRPALVMLTSQYQMHECFTDERTLTALERRCAKVRMQLSHTGRLWEVQRPVQPGEDPTGVPTTTCLNFQEALAAVSHCLSLGTGTAQAAPSAEPQAPQVVPETPTTSPMVVPSTPLTSIDWMLTPVEGVSVWDLTQ